MTKLGRELGVPHVETSRIRGPGTLTDKEAKASPDFTDITTRIGDDLAAILYTPEPRPLERRDALHGKSSHRMRKPA